MDHLRSHYLKFSSAELKEKIANYGGALQVMEESETYDSLHEFVNIMIDILKERNEL